MLQGWEADVSVLAVWEPISGQPAPAAAVVATLDDPRVAQIWDPEHIWSDAMRDAERALAPHLPQAEWRTGGTDDGVLYDTVAIFPAGTKWRETLPGPTYVHGGLEAVLPEVRELLDAR